VRRFFKNWPSEKASPQRPFFLIFLISCVAVTLLWRIEFTATDFARLYTIEERRKSVARARPIVENREVLYYYAAATQQCSKEEEEVRLDFCPTTRGRGRRVGTNRKKKRLHTTLRDQGWLNGAGHLSG